jgi:hypothetical protein
MSKRAVVIGHPGNINNIFAIRRARTPLSNETNTIHYSQHTECNKHISHFSLLNETLNNGYNTYKFTGFSGVHT